MSSPTISQIMGKNSYTVTELKKECKKLGITGYSKLKKKELVDKIMEKSNNEIKNKDESEDTKEKVEKVEMDDEDKAAVKAGKSDATVKAILTTPEEKKEKFNLGLKFIKKYKDDKAKVDAYLKKAKEEYKLPSSMIKDLKRTAGRDVAS